MVETILPFFLLSFFFYFFWSDVLEDRGSLLSSLRYLNLHFLTHQPVLCTSESSLLTKSFLTPNRRLLHRLHCRPAGPHARHVDHVPRRSVDEDSKKKEYKLSAIRYLYEEKPTKNQYTSQRKRFILNSSKRVCSGSKFVNVFNTPHLTYMQVIIYHRAAKKKNTSHRHSHKNSHHNHNSEWSGKREKCWALVLFLFILVSV